MNRQLQFLPTLGVLLLLAAPFINAQDKKGKGDKDPGGADNYYPLEVGNKWTFNVAVAGNSVTAISSIVKIEMINGKSMARLEAAIKDKVVANEHLRQTEEGIFRHRNNGQDIDPSICLLKYPVKAGAKWQGEFKVGNDDGKYSCESSEESIEVPAGKFKAIRVNIRLESKGQNVNTAYWFVKDIGFVKQTVDAGGLNIVMELEKFERAKPAPNKDKTPKPAPK